MKTKLKMYPWLFLIYLDSFSSWLQFSLWKDFQLHTVWVNLLDAINAFYFHSVLIGNHLVPLLEVIIGQQPIKSLCLIVQIIRIPFVFENKNWRHFERTSIPRCVQRQQRFFLKGRVVVPHPPITETTHQECW